MDWYLTLTPDVDLTAEIRVKGSRFLATARRTDDEGTARDLVSRLRRVHHDARHVCSAFVLGSGADGEWIERSNDDGEPSGTAGRPILTAINAAADGFGLTFVTVAVVRWFGGTLLGTGGLARAYADAATAALESALTGGMVIRRVAHPTFRVHVGMERLGLVEHQLRERFEVTAAEYAGTSAEFRVLASDPAALTEFAAQAGLRAERAGPGWAQSRFRPAKR